MHGPNGAGKTNLLEALYFGCTARSCRTTNEREVVRFDAPAARVEVDTRDRDGDRTRCRWASSRASRSGSEVDGAPVERLTDSPARPLVSVFLPDRLELVKGAPTLRRAHLDQLVAALWPARAAQPRAVLAGAGAAQRAARAGPRGPRRRVVARRLGRGAGALGHRAARRPRRRGGAGGASASRRSPSELGLDGAAELRYRPRSRAADRRGAGGGAARAPRESDLERGFTQHGPHRDDLVLLRDGRELKAYGSQGEQRLALLALLLAERAVLADERGAPPLMLLDDVMSELDADRRALLVARLDDGGQARR